jgi:sugar lactone lactonase YvrE
MKRKLIPIFASLALLLAITACQEYNEFIPQGANNKKNSKVLVKEIATGAVIKGANGINFGPDGNLYIGSVNGQEIIVMNKQNGKIIKRIGTDKKVTTPDDLTFGPDGSLYWTDIYTGEVGRMTPAGVVTKQPVAPGVNPITFSEDGRLFVGLCFLGDGLYELDPELLAPPRPIIVASAENNFFPLGFLNGFDFGPDGKLYGPLFAGGAVIRVNVGGPGTPPSTKPFEDGTAELVVGGFTVPAAAKFDSKGILHVLDQSGEVFKVNTLTGEKTLFVKIQPGLDNLAFDSKGSLFISNADFGSIVEILPSGQPRTISGGGMIGPMGLAVLPGSNKQDALFVGDLFRLRKHNGLTGKEEIVYKGDLLGGAGNLTTPFSLSADGENVIVSSWFGNVVQVWNPKSDEVLQTIPIPIPIDAIRFKGDIAVSALGLGGVVRASDKSPIFPAGTPIFAPSGLATDGETLWVADLATGTIWQLGFNGNTLGAPVELATGLKGPEGLAWDKKGGLLVVESGASRLSRIDLVTGVVSTVADGLKLSAPPINLDNLVPPSYWFDGVAVGQSGDVYVSGGGKNVIYRVSKY